MGGWVSEHSEDASNQISEAALLAPVAFRFEGINGEHRSGASKGFVNKYSAIIGKASPVPEFVSDAFGRFENGVKVVVG